MTTGLPKETISLLREVQEGIRLEPRRFEMSEWFYHGEQELEDMGIPEEDRPPCNTTACIAGHVVWNTEPEVFKDAVKTYDHGIIARRARELLQLSPQQFDRLTLETHWPDEFLTTGFSPKKKAELAIARIDCFIQTGGMK